VDASEILQAANRQLTAENNLLRSTNNQRSTDTATAMIDGLGVLLAEANRGNPAAIAALKTMCERFEAARTVASGIALPNGR
jgi:hypothetical protein